MFRDHASPVDLVRELRLPPPERAAARAERKVERELRRERDNVETAARRLAAIEAEARRFGGSGWGRTW